MQPPKLCKLGILSVQVPKNPDLGSDADRVRKEEQARIDEAEQLSEEELAEKEDLLREVGRVVVDVAQHSYCCGTSVNHKGVLI